MRRSFSVIILFFILTSFSYSLDKMVIAVSPFENLSGNKSENYIGFQISEYMASALGSIEDVTVVERGVLEKVLAEQNLQLSGMTEDGDAVELGNMLNAKQMLVGSYTVTDNTISLKGRIVDVETAEITASAQISGLFTGNINPVMQDFFYALLDKRPPEEIFSQMSVLEQRITKLESEKNESFTSEINELREKMIALESKGDSLEDIISNLKISLSVEAQLSMLKDMDQEASADNAKALEASFLSNDEDALVYLQSAISDPTKSYLSYSLAADSYYEKLSAIEGESFFVKMVKNQLEVNKVLSKDAEAISKYRNILKLLVSRLYSVLHPDMFTLNVGRTEQIEMGTVSAMITLPSNISINVNEGTKNLLSRVLETQDIIGNESSTYNQLVFKKSPPVLRKLLPNYGIKQLFPIELEAGIGYTIQFVDKNEDILFELVHDNLNSFNLATDSTTVWEESSDNTYSVKSARDGWSYRNGKVEVQARELRNLHGVRVVLDRRSFNMDYSFPAYSDTKWKSILLHAYRQKYIKIASDDLEDPMPQVKDLVVTHSVFSIGDYLENIPLIVDPDYISAAADLSAVAYWGDSSATVVTGQWTGLKSHTNENYIGSLSPETVLYFPMPAVMDGGSGTFTLSNNGLKRVYTFESNPGNTWENSSITANDLLVDGGRVYTAIGTYGSGNTACLDSNSGKLLWNNRDIRSENLEESGEILYTTYIRRGDYSRSKVSAVDKETGNILWVNDEISSDDLQIYGGKLYSTGAYRYVNTSCIDIETGATLWSNRDAGGKKLHVVGGKIFIIYDRYAACLDADTGELIWQNKDIAGTDLQAVGNRVYISGRNTACLNADTGKLLWKNKDINSKYLQVVGNNVYTDGLASCLNAQTGALLWQSEIRANNIEVIGGRVYTSGKYTSCIDADTGKLLWKNSEIDSTTIQAEGGRLYTNGGKAPVCLDISTIEPWYQYKKAGDGFYSVDDYKSAVIQYSGAYSEEGSRDGVVHYRYAYSKEQLEGLTPAVKNIYFQAWIRLKQQYPGHRYIEAAEAKME